MYKRQVRVWDLESGQLLEHLLPGESEVVGAVSTDGRVVALGDGQDIRLWSVEQGHGPVLRAHASPIQNLVLNHDGRVLVSGESDGAIWVWDLAFGESGLSAQPRSTAQPILYDGSGLMSLRPDGERLALAAKGSMLDIHDLRSGELLARNEAVHPGYALHDLEYSANGELLATTSFDKTIMIWDAETLEALGPALEGHEGRVLAAAFSPDSRTLASASTDNTVRLWDLAPLLDGEGPGTAVRPVGQPLTGHSNWVRSLAFLPHGKGIVSGDSDGHTMVWDTGRARQLAGHLAQVRGLAFSPDGRTLASGGLDSDIFLWDTVTGVPVTPPLTDHPRSVYNVPYRPDGRQRASGGAGGWDWLW